MERNESETLSMSAAPHGGESLVEQPRPGGAVPALDRWLVERILAAVGNPPVRFILWDGQEVAATREAAVARILVRDRGALLKLAANPNFQFGELYSAGRISLKGDLVAFLEAVYRAQSRMQVGEWAQKFAAWLNRPRGNSLAGSRDNIHHHYDIGNDFYRLWLDQQMLYTCAYYPSREASLEQAQVAKMDHVCRKLRLKPGETVVEAGCGWGALALHMARCYGVTVKAYNISGEQLAYARERARLEGMEGRVEYVEGDYREIRDRYDAFASVGMLEHVGVEHYRELGTVIDGCLKENGRGLIHSVGRNSPAPMHPWIERRIFPGAYPPSLGEMAGIFEPRGFSILDVENLRLHYAKTLEHWLERFEAAAERVARMFDDAFVRAWRLYLAGSLAAFAVGDLQLFQVVFARSDDNDIPWTRDWLYPEAGAHGKL